ncbi:peptidylprolyl isomerase [Agriterribacter sp.]|uniref:peptidylprolyl isomerase n=1 Tax=Agriterribacter sp. TaxID=2821509 RepID=UPI002C226613|nr:peptidylprolyl isomerase [Agriterribacter sp.]HRO48448.1 peptidylprolyl isomerase [Agriterribacter sp.]HRQ18741.1 peptidylprolyl isomerase [Agriterribacter sp.]
MKKLLILIVLLSPGIYLSAQTLFTYGKHKVDKEEFLRAFNKNNTAGANEQALQDYVDLFIAFKLKVQAAKDRKMDTLPAQKNDLLNFRRQIEADYMTDNNMIHALAAEAFKRSQEDIRLSHIFIPFDANYIQNPSARTATDTLAAFENIHKAYAELKNGSDFSVTAEKHSLDPMVKNNKGDIGFITVFSLPYELESVAYALRDGAFSMPYKSSAGYHIIKRTATRPAWGKMRAAQILLAYIPAASAEEKQPQKKLADSLYQALQKGSDFSALAKQFSSERNAYSTGGLMPDFGVGRYDPFFENAVYALQKDGDVSSPFETAFGIHIVKRIRHFPVSTDSTQSEALFKEAVTQDARIAIAREQFAGRIINEIGYKRQFEQDPLLWRLTDSFLVNNNFTPQKNITDQTVLFSFHKESKTIKDWLNFIVSVKSSYTGPLPYADLMKQFVATSAKSYYQVHLEDYNMAFRNQLTEFSEGNLLFEIMEEQVWDKAAKDKKGLETYYGEHKAKYTWGPSANAVFFTTADPETAETISSDINNYIGKWRTLGESSQGKIIADSARFELEQIPGTKQSIQPGKITERITDTASGATHFMYVLNVYDEPAQRSFEEARGLVINDYQAVLEAQWIKSLKKKYPVKINEKLLHALAK